MFMSSQILMRDLLRLVKIKNILFLFYIYFGDFEDYSIFYYFENSFLIYQLHLCFKNC
jgi:hypothetical protein